MKKKDAVTLEKVIVKIYPMNVKAKPYVVSFETVIPNAHASLLQEQIVEMLRREWIAEGIECISTGEKL